MDTSLLLNFVKYYEKNCLNLYFPVAILDKGFYNVLRKLAL